MAKQPNHRLIKIHRNYSVEEAARSLNVGKPTVRRWIKNGLPTVGGRGPTLMLGSEIREYLERQRSQAKRPCPRGHMYCFKCRAHRPPAGRMAEYAAITATSGNLTGLCGDCFTVMNRQTKAVDLVRLWADLEVTETRPSLHISASPSPSLNDNSA